MATGWYDSGMDTEQENVVNNETRTEGESDQLQPLITLASALLDTDRLLIAAELAKRPTNRMDLAAATGLSHRDLLRQLDILRQHGLAQLAEPAPRQPDHYSLYELNVEAFKSARKAMGKYKGIKPRPTDSRLLILDTFMPDGKLVAFPRKQEQIITILNEVARKFDPDKQYKEREVNVILEEVNEDYCTLRRHLVDYGYLSRSDGVYVKR